MDVMLGDVLDSFRRDPRVPAPADGPDVRSLPFTRRVPRRAWSRWPAWARRIVEQPRGLHVVVVIHHGGSVEAVMMAGRELRRVLDPMWGPV